MRKLKLSLGLIAIGLTGFGAFLFWPNSLFNDPISNEPAGQPAKPPLIDTIQAPMSLNQTLEADQLNQTTEPNSIQQSILLEITDRKFSSDPFTELFSLMTVMDHCIRNQGVGDIAVYYGIAYSVHEKMNQDLQIKCNEYHQQYPELIKVFKTNQGSTLFKPQSKLGHLIQTYLAPNTTDADRKTLSRLGLLEAIREKNGIILTQAGSLSSMNMKSHEFPISELLQSHDYKYLYQMNRAAIDLMSCQFNQGINCDSSSNLMRLTCAKNPLACGLDYPNWYEKNTLPGMKRDVETIIAFYQQLSL